MTDLISKWQDLVASRRWLRPEGVSDLFETRLPYGILIERHEDGLLRPGMLFQLQGVIARRVIDVIPARSSTQAFNPETDALTAVEWKLIYQWSVASLALGNARSREHKLLVPYDQCFAIRFSTTPAPLTKLELELSEEELSPVERDMRAWDDILRGGGG